MNKNIKELQSLIRTNLCYMNNILFKRKNKITTNEIFYYLTQLVNNPSASS